MKKGHITRVDTHMMGQIRNLKRMNLPTLEPQCH